VADFTKPSELGRAAENPAAPAGLKQTAGRMKTGQERFLAGESKLAPWLPKDSMLETAQSWYGGQNTEGVKNGWDTNFYSTMFAQRDEWVNKAQAENSNQRFYDWLNPQVNPNATGVVAWGADPTKTDKNYQGDRFGDVYQNGKKVANVYDDYDPATADVMMGEYLFTNDEKERMFRAPDAREQYRAKVEGYRQQNTEAKEYGKSAESFQRETEARERALSEGVGNEALIAGATVATGATVLGGIASAAAVSGAAFSWTGPGALLAAAAGGTIAGIAAWMNQDQLVELTARAQEVTDRSEGFWQTAGSALEGVGTVGSKLAMPFSNTVQGIYEVNKGLDKVGDHTSEFNKVVDGERQAPGWVQGLDVAAALTDGVLQFASPTGRWLYMGTMGTTVAGGAAGLTSGAGFNYSRGQFDKYENWKEWSAAIGSTGIDAVQMGMAGALASGARTARTAVGMESSRAATAGETALTRAGDRIWNKLPGTKKIEGETFETVNGMRFGLDSSGRAVSSRSTVELLAPSEMLRWIPTNWRARALKKSDEGALTADDLFRAAKDLSNPSSKLQGMILTGYAEAGEEAVQALFDPVSFGEAVDPQAVFQAAAYGFAGGAGMALGSATTQPSNARQEEYIARLAHTLTNNGQMMSDAEWKTYYSSLSPAQRKALAKTTPDQQSQIQGVIDSLTELHQFDATQTAFGLASLQGMKIAQRWEKLHNKALKEGNGSLVLMGMPADTIVTPGGTKESWRFPPNAAVMSAFETVNQIRNINKGLAKQRDFFQAVIAEQTKERAQTTDPELLDKIDQRIADATARMADLGNQRTISDQITTAFEDLYAQFVAETGYDEQMNLLDAMNGILRSAFNGELKDPTGTLYPPEMQTYAQRSVELNLARHPLIDNGSFALLMPQISPELTRVNAHGTVYTHQSTLKTLGGDHDGDTMVPQHDIYRDPAQLQERRRGTQYVREMTLAERKDAAKKDPRIDPTITRWTVVADAPDSEKAYVRTMSANLRNRNTAYFTAVNDGIKSVCMDFYNRYATDGTNAGPFAPEVVVDLLQEFEDNVTAGNENARTMLVEGLFNATPTAAQQLFAMADGTKVPELLWMMGTINVAWDSIQRQFGHLSALDRDEVKLGDPNRIPADNAYQANKARLDAATAADDLAAIGAVDQTRSKQSLHYSAFFQSSTELGQIADTGWTTEKRDQLTELYATLGTLDNRTDLEKIEGKTAITDRVVHWLTKIAETVPGTSLKTPELLLLLANVKVPDVQTNELNAYELSDGRITLLQLLLRKSLEIEQVNQRKLGPDSDVMLKINKLMTLTRPNGEKSNTAALALLEVYGNHQLYQLIGDASMYLGPQVTLNQLQMLLTGMHSDSRRRLVNSFKRSPAYFSHHGTGDAPWDARVLYTGQVNAFTMLVDAVASGARTSFQAMEGRDESAHKQFKDGLAGLHEWMDVWRAQHSERFQREGEVTDRAVLRDLLAKRPEVASMVVNLIPETAQLGVFKVVGTKVHTAKWVEEMLLERDTERAAKMLFLHTKLSEFNVMGGTIDFRMAEEGSPQNGAVGKVRYGRIESRFLQVIHELASDSDGVRLAAFLKMAHEAPDLKTLFTRLNNEPQWRGDRERLLPYHDDVKLFEVDPKDVWNPGMPGALQRENLKGWGERMALYGERARAEAAALDSNRKVIANMQAYSKDPKVDVSGASVFYGLLKQAIENRRRFPDANGQAAREQMVELLQVGLARMHDKGKVDESARAMGEPLITMDSWGYKNGLLLETDALTVRDWDDIKTNLTKLVEGPVRVQMRDGSILTLDMSNVDTALEMLADPDTQAFAIAVLFPSVRDVNVNGVVQTYQDVDNTGLIEAMLQEQTFAHLFNDTGGWSSRVAQAHRYIGTVEAYVRRASLDQPVESQARMYFPIQNMINDFILAYGHSPKAGKVDPEKVRQQLIVDVADAIKAVATLEPAERGSLRDAIKAVMLQRYGGDDSRVSDFLASDPEKQLVREAMLNMAIDQFKATLSDLEQQGQAADAAGDQAEFDRVIARIDQLEQQMSQLEDGNITAIPAGLFVDVQSVLDQWTMIGADPVDIPRKASLLRYLARKHRLNRIENKDTADLVSAVRAAVLNDPAQVNNPDLVGEKEWNELGAWASTIFISELATRSSSEVGMAPILLGEEGDQIRRYYDKTWSYLVDGLFDDNVLAGATVIKQQALHNVDLTVSDVAKQIEDGLLNPNKMGEWTDRIPIRSMEARQILLRAPVGAAIQTEGNDPKELGDLIASGWVTWKLPDPTQHISNWTMPIPDGGKIVDALSDQPHAYVKLQNHFVNRLELTATDAQGNPVSLNLLDTVGQINSTHEDVANSPYRVLNLSLLDKALADLRSEQGLTGIVVEIDYVDISKMPASKEFANNIFFDGVGRESAAGTSPGPVAALFFALGGLSKIGQQNPLDQATKKGKQFRAFLTTALDEVVTLEAGGKPVEEILMDKALHLWAQEYPGGFLLNTDLPALYKMMRMRHVVVGYNAAGDKEVMWPEQAMEYQRNGGTIPLSNVDLVPLSDSVAQTLHGGSGYFGLKDVATRPVLNLQDVQAYPPLTAEWLDQLGLSRLGEKGIANRSDVTTVSSLPRAAASRTKAGPLRTRWQHRSEKWRGELSRVHDIRGDKREAGKGKFDISRMNEVNAKRVVRMLAAEQQGDTFSKMGVPHPAMQNLASLEVSATLAANIDKYMGGDNSILWVHDQTAATDLNNGVLGVASTNAESYGRNLAAGPVFGDAVAVRLDTLLAATGDKTRALSKAKEVIEEYTDRGLVIVLVSENGDHQLRAAVAAWLNEGAQDYMAANDSGHIFVPILEDPTVNATSMMLHSSLQEKQVFSTEGLELALVADESADTGLSEGVQYVDLQHSRSWRRIVSAILPSAITGSVSTQDKSLYAFNVPAKGTDGVDQFAIVASKLKPLLQSPEGRAWLAEMAGGVQGDPEGFNKHRVNPNGTVEPGILGLEDALTKLMEQLDAGIFPTDPGQVLQTGAIIPLITGTDTILLSRVGFDLPDMNRMGEMIRTPKGQPKFVAGGPLGEGIAISRASISSTQTVPPPFTVDKVMVDHRGLRVIGTYDQGQLAKEISEGTGLKEGLAPLPKGLNFLKQAMSAMNGTRVTKIKSKKGVISKEAGYGVVDNFRWAFATYGMDFRQDLIEFFWGPLQDPNDEVAFKTAWDKTRTILDLWANTDHGLSAQDIERGLDAESIAIVAQNGINSILARSDENYTPLDLQQDPDGVEDPKRRLALLVIASLMAPRITVDDVVSTSGLLTVNSRDSKAQVALMPALLTDALDDIRFPELRAMLFQRMNSRMPINPDTGNPAYFMHPDWTFDVEMFDENANGGKGGYVTKTGNLQMTLPIPADENSVQLSQAALKSKTQISPHIARTTQMAGGGIQTTDVKRDKNGDIIGLSQEQMDELWNNEILSFESGSGQTVWDMLRRVSTEDVPYNPWERTLPLQTLHLRESDRKMRAYVTPIDKTDKVAWPDRARAESKADELLEIIGLTQNKVIGRFEVDYLVRQFLGRPGKAEGQEVFVEEITQSAYIQAVDLMLENVGKKLHPLHGGVVPLEHHNFWRMVYDANEKRPVADRWRPATKITGERTEVAKSWYEWVESLMGQVRESNTEFHSMFRQDLDGHWHTYQGTASSLLTQQLSWDELTSLKLMDAEANRFYLSMDPSEDALMKDPIILDNMLINYSTIMGHAPTFTGLDARTTEVSDLAQQIERQKAWLNKQRITPQKQVSIHDYARQGVEYLESQRKTTNFFRGLTNLSITMRLANPALYVSAFFEVPFRNVLEQATNMLTGGYTGAGAEGVGRLQAKAGVKQRFTPDDLDKIQRLSEQLGNSNMWLGELFKEMTYQNYVEVGSQGKVSSFLEKSAFTTAKVTSDPRWGMRNTSAAKRYLEAAWEYMVMTNAQITVEQFVAAMTRDPLWLKKNSPEGRFSAHRAGLNRVAQVRSTKATTLGKAIMSPVDSLTASDALGANMFGHLLKIPLMFTRFNVNAFMTLTGLGGFDQAAAMFFDRRQPGPFMGRMRALATMSKYEPEKVRPMDLSDVIESVDLARSFTKGAITQTGLMIAGMMAGGLGLGGEDEEERKRRRMAEYLNIPYYRDPRRAQNDFRWTDAIFLDDIPVLNTLFSTDAVTADENGNTVTIPGHSAVVPHWILKQFLSPALGVARFFETGDAREIGYGFQEAIAVLPTSVMNLWSEADLTAKLLIDAAKDTEGVNAAEVENQTSQLMINVVGMYEKALIENSFVNSIRQAGDHYDRNPWVIPMTANENTGELDRTQGENLPQSTNAMRTFVRPDGSIGQAYATRTGDDAVAHQYAENNFTAAVLMSLITGQFNVADSSFMRQNMAVKERTVQLTPTSKAEAEALFHQAFMAPGHQTFMTKDEIQRVLKARDEAAGIYWKQESIEAQADAIWESQNGKEFALSVLDDDGKEVIAKEGARAIFTGLQKGTVKFGDPSLANVGISQEMRDEIAKEWLTELVQEGVDLGLPESAAKYRANRLWWGDQENPAAPGLREIIYSNKISVQSEATYKQLNTTYAIGPDGRPWATPFQRMNVMQSLGVPTAHRMTETIPGVTGRDERGNTVDLVRGINTGLASLEPELVIPELVIPDNLLDEVNAKTVTPSRTPYGRRSYGYGRRGYGGYSGGGSSWGPNFQRMDRLPEGTSARADWVPMINTNTPIIRRADVRRERISSERGRLKQWQ
jgi:hypothetical protein